MAIRRFVCNFAHPLTNTKNEMEEKEQKSFDYPDNYDPGIGPYTLEELEARIDRTEEDADDPSKWI